MAKVGCPQGPEMYNAAAVRISLHVMPCLHTCLYSVALPGRSAAFRAQDVHQSWYIWRCTKWGVMLAVLPSIESLANLRCESGLQAFCTY